MYEHTRTSGAQERIFDNGGERIDVPLRLPQFGVFGISTGLQGFLSWVSLTYAMYAAVLLVILGVDCNLGL